MVVRILLLLVGRCPSVLAHHKAIIQEPIMNILEFFKTLFTQPRRLFKPTPADFRRGKRPLRIVGYLKDPNSKHAGSFKGKITPMKRRFKGVSLTAKGK